MQKSKLQFKIKTLASLFVISIGFVPLFVSAAMLSLSPATVNVTKGQNLTMTVILNPQGLSVYTAKMELRFPSNLLEVKSFSFTGDSWRPLSQPGYDMTDNINGALVKTAGYPGGISSQVNLGTVTFLAKSSGTGTLTIVGTSAVYDAGSKNILSGIPVSALVVINAPVTPAPKPTLIIGKVIAPTPSPTQVSSDGEFTDEMAKIKEEKEGNVAGNPEQGSLLAVLSNAVSFNNIIIIILILAAVLYKLVRDIIYRYKKF